MRIEYLNDILQKFHEIFHDFSFILLNQLRFISINFFIHIISVGHKTSQSLEFGKGMKKD